MSKTTMTIIAVLVVIFIGGAFYYATGDDNAQNSPLNNGGENGLNFGGDQNGQSGEAPDEWETYTSTSSPRFSFQHPEEARVDHEAGNVRVRLIGPESGQDTEITDGFTWYVRPLDGAVAASLQASAQQRFAAATANLEATVELEQTTVSGMTAYTFMVENQLGGETTHVVFEEGGVTYEVTYTISEPAGADRNYQETIDTMIGTVSSA